MVSPPAKVTVIFHGGPLDGKKVEYNPRFFDVNGHAISIPMHAPLASIPWITHYKLTPQSVAVNGVHGAVLDGFFDDPDTLMTQTGPYNRRSDYQEHPMAAPRSTNAPPHVEEQ